MENLGLTDSMLIALNHPTISAREFPRMTPPSVLMVSLGIRRRQKSAPSSVWCSPEDAAFRVRVGCSGDFLLEFGPQY